MSKKIETLPNNATVNSDLIANSNSSEDPTDLGILQEVGNIGAGHAATSLSTVLQQEVSIDIPRICCLPPHLVGKYYNRGDMSTTAVLMQLTRDYECDILLMFEYSEAKKIAALMTMAPSVEELDESMEESAIQELANIVIGSFLTAISDFTGVQLIPTPPLRVVDTFDAVLDTVLVKQSMIAEKALVFDACFKRQGTDAKSILIIFPSPELKAILVNKSKAMLGLEDESLKEDQSSKDDAVHFEIASTETIKNEAHQNGQM
jgi:chemotaxis protein CheC